MKYTLNDFDGDAQGQVDPDVLLIFEVAAGDRASFEKLYDRFAPLVYSVVQQVLERRADVEEVVQELFVSLWERAGRYSTERGKPANWIGTMARNRAIDRLRANRRRVALSQKYEGELEGRTGGETIGADEFAIRSDDRQLVLEALEALSPEQREALEATYLRGMTQREAARQLGHPLGTLKARVRRGLVVLRETLTSRAGGELAGMAYGG